MLINAVNALYHLAHAARQTMRGYDTPPKATEESAKFFAAMRYFDTARNILFDEVERAITGKPVVNINAATEARQFVVLAVEQLDKTNTKGFPVDTLAIIAAISAVMVTHEKELQINEEP